ncbi:MAG: hypothetical protein KDD50_01545 [Bdellovibrionales bacterium]|nr:hypothetical protein [Bdellovibrionales bacterium]
MKFIILLFAVSVLSTGCGKALNKNNFNTDSSNEESLSGQSNLLSSSSSSSNVVVGDGQNTVGFASTGPIYAVDPNASAQEDCSSDQAEFYSEIVGVDYELYACAEFSLTVPANHSRRGEFSFCDNPSKFVDLRQNKEWEYISSTRTWRFKGFTSKNHSRKIKNTYFAPGIYRGVAKTKSGDLIYSNFAKIGRVGHGDCSSSSSSTTTVNNTNSCGWLGFPPGPVPNPTASCTKSNEGQIATVMQTTYTCTCN